MSQLVYSHASAADRQQSRSLANSIPRNEVAVLTAGRDKPYALGLAEALSATGIYFDFIGSDELDSPKLQDDPHVRFLKLRDQRLDAGYVAKILRVIVYYIRLFCYAATSKARLFHILWNNKFELFDRTFLMAYYKGLRKRVILTVHNVNAGVRDADDSTLNRLSLRIQYHLSDHIFTHTKMMRQTLLTEFKVPADRVTVIPFGINNTLPNTPLLPVEAKNRLGLEGSNKTLLFFGNIAPYKGLEYLVSAFIQCATADKAYRLIIAGRPKGAIDYWDAVHEQIAASGLSDCIVQRVEFIPDEEAELYFKAADVLVLPYKHVFQSGVLFLGYSFGLPAIATDVGSLREEIVDGQTGFVCPALDSVKLADAIRRYFDSNLYRELAGRRGRIQEYANERYSWSKIAQTITDVYSRLLTV